MKLEHAFPHQHKAHTKSLVPEAENSKSIHPPPPGVVHWEDLLCQSHWNRQDRSKSMILFRTGSGEHPSGLCSMVQLCQPPTWLPTFMQHMIDHHQPILGGPASALLHFWQGGKLSKEEEGSKGMNKLLKKLPKEEQGWEALSASFPCQTKLHPPIPWILTMPHPTAPISKHEIIFMCFCYSEMH